MTNFEITFVNGEQKNKVEINAESKGDALNAAIHKIYGDNAYFSEESNISSQIRKFGQVFNRVRHEAQPGRLAYGADDSTTGRIYIDIYEV